MSVFNFEKTSEAQSWYIVNDVVMGGMSSAKVEVNEEGHGVFSGTVSLENNGGFASMRHSSRVEGVSQYRKVALRVKGDGKQYQFRLRKSTRDRESYISKFTTTGEWQTIEIPLADLYPSFRGRKLDLPKFEGEVFEEVTILIANYKPENFRLEVDWIELRP